MSIRITHLKRFLPGLDDRLADAPTTELMVDGSDGQAWNAPGAGLENLPAPQMAPPACRLWIPSKPLIHGPIACFIRSGNHSGYHVRGFESRREPSGMRGVN